MEKLYLEMRNAFYNINFFLDTLDFESKDEYKKINRTYFLINRKHYEAFLVLIDYRYNSPSSFVVGRTILETFVKSCYTDCILKSKSKPVNVFLMKENKFPKYHYL